MGRSTRSAGELPVGVRRRGSKFTAHGYDPDRPGGSKHLGTFASVEEAVAAREAHQRAQARRKVGYRDWTCDEFAGIWCVTDYLRPEESSNEYYRGMIRPFVRDFEGVLLRDVTWDMARLWSEGGVVRPDLVSVASRWKGAVFEDGALRVPSNRPSLKAVKALFRDAKRSNLIERNPWAALTIRKGRGRKDEVPPTVEQLKLAIQKARELNPRTPAVPAMIQFAAYSGLRLGELMALRWEDVDFESQSLRVVRQIRRTVDGSYAEPKHGAKRNIVLTPQAAAAIRELPRSVDGFVFHTAQGRLFMPRTWAWYWYPVRAAVPGMERTAFHMLRHFYGSLLGNQPGVTPRDIAHQLGHKDGGRLAAELYCHTDERVANSRVAALFVG